MGLKDCKGTGQRECFGDFLFVILFTPVPFWKRVFVKERNERKEAVFPFFKDPFSESRKKDRVSSESVYIHLNPFMPNGLFYHNSLDRSISNSDLILRLL